MKVLFLLTISSLAFSQTAYQNGFNKGFQEGYCYGNTLGCIAPPAPIAPPDIKNDYTSGYNNGFTTGKSENKSTNSNQVTGGWRGQIKPTNQGPAVTEQQIQNMQNAWAGYYERRAVKKEQKRQEQEVNSIFIYDKTVEISNILNDLKSRMQEKKFTAELIEKEVGNFNKENQAIYDKYSLSPNKIHKFMKENIELRQRITSYIEGAKL